MEPVELLAEGALDRASCSDKMLTHVYDDLRQLAYTKLSHEKAGLTLQATALVHEAYLRLVESAPDKVWEDRGTFIAAIAQAMRRILIEQARRRKSLKRGGNHVRRSQIPIEDFASTVTHSPEDALILDEAFTVLEEDDPQAASVARLRIFAGLGLDAAAEALGMARTTAFRHWTYARAFLQHEYQTRS